MLVATVACLWGGYINPLYMSSASAETSEQSSYDVGDVEVTSEVPEQLVPAYVTGGDVNVITRKDIERKNFSSLSEALKTFPLRRRDIAAANTVLHSTQSCRSTAKIISLSSWMESVWIMMPIRMQNRNLR